MNKVKNGKTECMCIGCVNNLMERIIGYLEFKNEETDDIIGDIEKQPINGNGEYLKYLKEESKDVSDMIKELNEFKEYNDSIIKETIKD